MTQAIGGPKVPSWLMQPLAPAKCAIDPTKDPIPPQELAASNLCLSVAEKRARSRLHGLQDAVRKREAAVARAQKAAVN